MIDNAAQDAEPRSLADYAWKVLAPRECGITILINGPIALLVYRRVDHVPLLGWLSLLVICGPMSFLLPLLTTYFGYMNGVLARVHRRAGSTWPEGARWKTKAWLAGLRASAVVGLTTVLLCCGLDRILPNLQLTKAMAITVVALYAGIFGFFLHGRAVIQVDVLYNERTAMERTSERED